MKTKLITGLIKFFKKDTVLGIAILLAVLSAFWVRPDRAYTGYIDYRTLAVLFCLMTVMAGLRDIGGFDFLAQALLGKMKRMWQAVFVLVMLCFFFSMLITNDVALITFVPLTIILLSHMDETVRKRWLVPVVVMQTIAANLGSMLTPIGNPQNLYLYGISGMGPAEFSGLMLPYTLAAFLMLSVWSIGAVTFSGRKNKAAGEITVVFADKSRITDYRKLALYIVLFFLSLLTVAKILPYGVPFFVVLLSVGAFDRTVLKKVDYSLLGTFIAFFIFIGNIGRIPAFSQFLQNIIEGHETVTAIIASQVMSNVPAALLLSGFTNRYEALIIGVNVGGLGTLIASMASLISYKYIAREEGVSRGGYLVCFTCANLIFLICMMGVFVLQS